MVQGWTATRTDLRRLVYLGGYRMTRLPAWVGDSHPLPETTLRRLYLELGPYEASKVEAHFAVRAGAEELGVPLTIISPSTVAPNLDPAAQAALAKRRATLDL